VACRRTAGERKPFLIDVRILSRVFRGKFISLLKRAHKRGELEFHGQLSELAQPAAFERRIDASVQRDWVVYAKRPFGGPQQVLRYLARYTHRVAISDQRLLELKDGHVRFQYKDYADGQRSVSAHRSHPRLFSA
ncbi:MAG: transposase, partial [Hyphomicrobium sp.]